MNKSRKKIPPNIAASVRRRCGFGCVICGFPVLVEIDHIEEYSKEQKHDEKNLTLLCSNHHSEKTKGLLTKEEVIKANNEPFAIKNKTSSPYPIRLNEQSITVKFGSCTSKVSLERKESNLIVLDGQTILSVLYKNERPLLSMRLYGESNKLLVSIIKNKMTFLNDAFDIKNEGKTMTVREKKGEILLELEFDSPGIINIKKGKLKYNDRIIKITQEKIDFEGTIMASSYFEGPIGLACGKELQLPAAIFMPGTQKRNY